MKCGSTLYADQRGGAPVERRQREKRDVEERKERRSPTADPMMTLPESAMIVASTQSRSESGSADAFEDQNLDACTLSATRRRIRWITSTRRGSSRVS
jgi:hypothetical protein